jgi:hypothetical protein
MTPKIGLSSPADLDPEAIAWLRRAYEANILGAILAALVEHRWLGFRFPR